MPGYGLSTGQQMSSRSENVMNGPALVVQHVMKELKIKNAVISGYDWGGSIALKMGIHLPQLVKKLNVFHPSYHETEKDELKKIKAPTLIQWVRQEQFHSWKSW